MKRNLRKITVTLDERVVRWARGEASRNGTSISVMLGEILKERMLKEEAYAKAMRRALARKPFLKSKGPYLSRNQVHDRAGLR